MNITRKEAPGPLKGFIKQLPGFQTLNNIKHGIMRIQQLSELIKLNRVIVFSEYLGTEINGSFTHQLAHEVVNEWIDLYGIIYLRRTTASAIDSQGHSRLLWHPMAMLEIPFTHEEYLRNLKRETRKNIRKAEREGYIYDEFDWNNHLDEIYEINTSKEVQQFEKMRGWYREPVKPRYYNERSYFLGGKGLYF